MNKDIKLHQKDLPDGIDFNNSDRIACDCEFNGLNFDRDRLCLVQISSGNNDAHIIQLNRENYNAPNLKKVLTNKNIKKIFHFASEDLAFIKKLARSYSSNHGLKDLIKEFIGTDISKQLQNSDFGGKLTEKQLNYCANDVIYLHKIYDDLIKILTREERIDLYNNAIKFIKTRVDLDLAYFREDIWSH